MKGIRLKAPGGLDQLHGVELPDPGAPGRGEIRVRLHASSLNYHDYRVLSVPGSVADGRVPMSDGAGVVEAVGAGVTEFKPGDRVVSAYDEKMREGTILSIQKESTHKDYGSAIVEFHGAEPKTMDVCELVKVRGPLLPTDSVVPGPN